MVKSHVALACLYLKVNLLEKAKKQIQKAVDLEPENQEANRYYKVISEKWE